MRVITVLLALLLGGIGGGAAVWWWLQPAAPAPSPAPSPPPAISERTTSAVGDGTVWVTFANGVDQRRVAGVVIAQHDVVIVQAADYIPSDSAWWYPSNGVRQRVEHAVAWNLDVGLIAFSVGPTRADGLLLTAEDGALYLGRDVVVIADQVRTPAFVDSAAIETGVNDYRYEIQTRAALDANTTAIVLAADNTLIGLGMGGHPAADGDRLRAVDAATLRELLATRDATVPLSLADFAQYLLSTPQGMLAQIERNVAAGRWRNALELATQLNAQFGAQITPHVRTLARTSAAQLARGYLAAEQPAGALSTLTEALEQFGASAELLQLVTDLYLRQDRADAAIALLRRYGGPYATGSAQQRSAALSLLRQVISQRVAEATMPAQAAITLLRDALADDPQFALYHRQLGALYHAAGQYQLAEFHLQRAVQLDPQYAADVELALRQSRQRRQISELIEVPMVASGSALYVDAQLNGSAASFRFLLDTGASYTAINTATLLRLGLTDIFARGAVPLELETAAGRIYAQSFTLDSINVAGAIVYDVPVVILEDMGPLDGLLGLSFLSHFDVDINQREGKLLLTPR